MGNANKETEDKAVRRVMDFEQGAGREPEDVRLDKAHRGYDVFSTGRMIEVKGARESWKSYNWIPLHKTSVECLQKNPASFYLYVVKFAGRLSDKVENLYIIPGTCLLAQGAFRIKVENYRLTPVSRKSLKAFQQPSSIPSPPK